MKTFIKIIPFLILATLMACPKRLKTDPIATVVVVHSEIEIIDSSTINQQDIHMNYDTDNTLSSTCREAKELANEIYQRVYVLYYVSDDEFDYTEIKPKGDDPNVSVMREVRPDPITDTGCTGLKYNTVK